jgi:hypothetical protein
MPTLPREAWSVRAIDLRLRYKSKSVDLVWLRRGCKVRLRAGRDRVSGQGGGERLPDSPNVPPEPTVATLP